MGRDFLNITVAFTFRAKWATMLHPILRQGIRLFIGTTSETRNYILLSTRGRRSCCSQPKVALLAADGSITRGREQHERDYNWFYFTLFLLFY